MARSDRLVQSSVKPWWRRSRLADMATQLRHSIATSERYYAAIDRSRAGRRLKDAWKENQIVIRQISAIDNDNEVTG